MAVAANARSATVSNADVRALFLSSAIRKCQWSNPSQTPATGTTLSVTLPKAGIGRALLVTCSLPLTISASGCIPSPKAPFNVFTNAHLQDYSGLDRVNASVYMLSQLAYIKRRGGWEPSSGWPYSLPGSQATTDPYVNASYPFGLSAPYTPRTNEGGGANSFSSANRWNVPLASGNLVFSFWVPIAFDMNDTRGALRQWGTLNPAKSVNAESANTELAA